MTIFKRIQLKGNSKLVLALLLLVGGALIVTLQSRSYASLPLSSRVPNVRRAGVGPNDFRISEMGPSGDSDYVAERAAVAYNPTADEYLVVWSGADQVTSPAGTDIEIYGQRFDAVSGREVGPNNFRISDMGPEGQAGYFATFPAVVYNETDDEYLVVWAGDDVIGLAENETEIYVQRLAGASGAEIGTNDARISTTGADGNFLLDVFQPDVIYNRLTREYLVVWYGDGNLNRKMEIFGQRLNGNDATEVGVDDFPISDMGPASDAAYDARSPHIALNSVDNEYLVVWQGNDNVGSLSVGEVEIFGQRLNGTTVGEIGVNDFRISDMGPDGNGSYDVIGPPALTYNTLRHEYVVVWAGDDNRGALVDEEYEIFGQRIDASTGVALGSNDFPISEMGGSSDADFDALYPQIVHMVANDLYLVIWSGDNGGNVSVDDEFEVFGKWLANDGTQFDATHFQISDMGPDGQSAFGVERPAVANRVGTNLSLVVWQGNDQQPDLADDEIEIFGQQVIYAPCKSYLPVVWNRPVPTPSSSNANNPNSTGLAADSSGCIIVNSASR